MAQTVQICNEARMEQVFEDALAELMGKYLGKTPIDDIIAALQVQLYALAEIKKDESAP